MSDEQEQGARTSFIPASSGVSEEQPRRNCIQSFRRHTVKFAYVCAVFCVVWFTIEWIVLIAKDCSGDSNSADEIPQNQKLASQDRRCSVTLKTTKVPEFTNEKCIRKKGNITFNWRNLSDTLDWWNLSDACNYTVKRSCLCAGFIFSFDKYCFKDQVLMPCDVQKSICRHYWETIGIKCSCPSTKSFRNETNCSSCSKGRSGKFCQDKMTVENFTCSWSSINDTTELQSCNITRKKQEQCTIKQYGKDFTCINEKEKKLPLCNETLSDHTSVHSSASSWQNESQECVGNGSAEDITIKAAISALEIILLILYVIIHRKSISSESQSRVSCRVSLAVILVLFLIIITTLTAMLIRSKDSTRIVTASFIYISLMFLLFCYNLYSVRSTVFQLCRI